jgi:hypothetical protein
MPTGLDLHMVGVSSDALNALKAFKRELHAGSLEDAILTAISQYSRAKAQGE